MCILNTPNPDKLILQILGGYCGGVILFSLVIGGLVLWYLKTNSHQEDKPDE
jgi:hypothetical protein